MTELLALTTQAMIQK